MEAAIGELARGDDPPKPCRGDGETGGAPESVADLGEWGLIGAMAGRMPAGPLTIVGSGDDAAVIGAPSGSVVATVDLVLEGRHFLRSWSSGYDVGVKGAARGLADVAAMGAVPTALLVALAAPAALPVSWAVELADGLAYEAGRAGAGVAGGDIAGADSVVLSVTGLGDLACRRPVRRSGAAPGNVVAVAGPLGHSAAGYALLAAGARAHPELIAAHLRPAPPYDAGPQAALLGATAMIDVSDGLVADLGHVAEASGVAINIDSSRLALGDPLAGAAALVLAPGSPSARTYPADSPQSLALEWALTGGEDHSLVATFPGAADLPPRWRLIGAVHAGHGVTIDGRPHRGSGGWEHFRSGAS